MRCHCTINTNRGRFGRFSFGLIVIYNTISTNRGRFGHFSFGLIVIYKILTGGDLGVLVLGLLWSGESGSWISEGGWMLTLPEEVASSCSVSSEWPSSGAAFSVILSNPKTNVHLCKPRSEMLYAYYINHFICCKISKTEWVIWKKKIVRYASFIT